MLKRNTDKMPKEPASSSAAGVKYEDLRLAGQYPKIINGYQIQRETGKPENKYVFMRRIDLPVNEALSDKGPKIHVSVASQDLAKAWDVMAPVLNKEGVNYMKVWCEPEDTRQLQPGKAITIYSMGMEEPEKLEGVAKKIDAALKRENIQEAVAPTIRHSKQPELKLTDNYFYYTSDDDRQKAGLLAGQQPSWSRLVNMHAQSKEESKTATQRGTIYRSQSEPIGASHAARSSDVQPDKKPDVDKAMKDALNAFKHSMR